MTGRLSVCGARPAFPLRDSSLTLLLPYRCKPITFRLLGLVYTASKSCDAQTAAPASDVPPRNFKASSRTHPMHRRK